MAPTHRGKKSKHSWVCRSLISSPCILSLAFTVRLSPSEGHTKGILGGGNQDFSPTVTLNLFTQSQSIITNYCDIQVQLNYTDTRFPRLQTLPIKNIYSIETFLSQLTTNLLVKEESLNVNLELL